MSEKLCKVTHAVTVVVGEDGRKVDIWRGDHGSYQFEWSRPDDDASSLAHYSTKVAMTEASFLATIKGGLEIMYQTGALERPADDDDDTGHLVQPDFSDHEDAERYRAWRDNMLLRPAEMAKALAAATQGFVVDEAIDRLFR